MVAKCVHASIIAPGSPHNAMYFTYVVIKNVMCYMTLQSASHIIRMGLLLQ